MPHNNNEEEWNASERAHEESQWELSEVTVPVDNRATSPVEQMLLSPAFEERANLGLKRVTDIAAESGFAVITGSHDDSASEMVFTRVRLGRARPKGDRSLLEMGSEAAVDTLATMTAAWNTSHNFGEGYVIAGSFHWHTHNSPFSETDLQIYDDWTQNKPLYPLTDIQGSEQLVAGIFIPHMVPSTEGRRGKPTVDKVTLLMIQGPAENNIYQGRYSSYMRAQQEALKESGLTTWAIDLPVTGSRIDFTPIQSALKQIPPRGKKEN